MAVRRCFDGLMELEVAICRFGREGRKRFGNGCCERPGGPGSFSREWRGHSVQVFELQEGKSVGQRASCSKVKGHLRVCVQVDVVVDIV